jgi:hypothetical protein
MMREYRKNVRFDSATASRLHSYARQTGHTDPEVIRTAVAEYLDTHGKNESTTIFVENPQTGELTEIASYEVTQAKLIAMARLMDDEVYERLHEILFPCAPGHFFAKYAAVVGAKAAGALWFSK